MILPQSTAYRTLNDRLATVSTHNQTLLSAAATGGVRRLREASIDCRIRGGKVTN